METGKTDSQIFIADNASPVEKYAASEMKKYIRTATKMNLNIAQYAEVPSSKNIILIGNWKTDPEIKKLLHAGVLKVPEVTSKSDSFVIKTLKFDSKNYLVLAGASGRGTLYSVYFFLQEFLNIGFFWEGDIVPPHDGKWIPDNVDIVETPYFNMRFYMQECPFVYSTVFWNIEDWKKELDWMGKKKLNALMVPVDNWNCCVKMSEVVKEAKKRGIMPVFGGECTRFEIVDKSFMQKNENHNYVKMRWWKNAPYFCLHPQDSLFIGKGRKAIRKLVKNYGKGNIYFFSPYGEQTIMDISDNEILKIRTSYADSVQKIIKEEDPDGFWIYWTWPFISPPWPESHVKDFIGRMSDKNAFVCDSS
ncbi:MAG: alpha-N-acetylglucosaminidase TIM-barrel domain-containing protein, partial [Victivallaceae bacterium]|nr:alpha-N-acetylglucosaminidase TIM-barrel domain-containing protein [Victivallaceae bacterium]